MKKSFIRKDKTYIIEKVKEAFSSVFPIIFIIFILCLTVAPVDSGTFLTFICGSVFVVVGMGLFTLGADVGMTPIGEYVGSSTIKTKKMWIIVPVFFVIGTLITVCEPDLQVFSNYLDGSINKWVLLISVGVGVGLFLVVALLKTLLKIRLSYILIFSYAAVFILSAFVPPEFVPLSFDSSGVTTGPMSVPFIMAIGLGISSISRDGKDPDDGLGLTALCSIGPIISVMILGIIFKTDSITPEVAAELEITTSKDLAVSIGRSLLDQMNKVGQALLPIVGFFLIFRLFGNRIAKDSFLRILIGVLYTYVGMVLFMTGVSFGFEMIGYRLGVIMGELDYNWVLIPLGFILGFFAVAAEPAVHVLVKQVYEITDGAIPKKLLRSSLMIGVGISVALAFLRIYFHLNIYYFLVPVYAIALILTFFVPNIFTAIAFDSGGVASGALAASFILPMALGFCKSVGGNMATEGFGVIAMVAMTPLITIQILGLVYKIKIAKAKKAEKAKVADEPKHKEQIIE